MYFLALLRKDTYADAVIVLLKCNHEKKYPYMWVNEFVYNNHILNQNKVISKICLNIKL